MERDLRKWLSGIGLGGHADSFDENGVDWDVLHELTEADLKERGLSLGDRKRLLKAVGGLKGVEPAPAPVEPPRPVVVAGAQPSLGVQSGLTAQRRSMTAMCAHLAAW